MRSRTALACMSFALVARLSFADAAEDSPKVVELKAKLAEVQARVAKELPKAEKAAAAAEKALPNVTKQREQCEERAAAAKSVCEDNCEETMRRCVNANYLRSNAKQACEDRGEACSTKCSESSAKTCAALNAKEDKLSQTTRVPDQLKNELEEATEAPERARKAERDAAEAEERARKAERDAAEKAARAAAEKAARDAAEKAARDAAERRFVFKDGNLVLDTKTNLTWMRSVTDRGDWSQAAEDCKGKHMRLPTKDEALEIVIVKNIREDVWKKVWPTDWETWTSTPDGQRGAWLVLSNGGTFLLDVDLFHRALCVR